MNDHVSQLSDLEKAEMLKNIVTGCAEGGSRDDSRDYAVIRMLFLREPKISEKLPRFIKTCRNLPEIWSFIKPKFAHYHERREFIREEFDSLLAMLEMEARSPSDVSISETVQNVSSAYIQEVWKKALERRATDPEGATPFAPGKQPKKWGYQRQTARELFVEQKVRKQRILADEPAG